MVNRRQTMLALAAFAAAPLSCSRRSHGANTVRFWAVGREGEYAVELLQDFLRERPDIEVDVQKLPWTAAHEKLLTATPATRCRTCARSGTRGSRNFTR